MTTPKRPTYIRDISWLKFNERVLQEAIDPSNPLYDRLKFLGIFSNNQDEFFRVRVAALNRMADWKKNTRMHLEQNPKKILQKINQIVKNQSALFDKTYKGILNELAEEKIYMKNEKELTEHQAAFVRNYFIEEVRSIIIPLMIESIPKLPLLKDNTIYLASKLGSSHQSLMHRYALIEVPTQRVPRFIQIPSARGEYHFILLEDVIRFNLPYIFSPLGFDKFSGYIIKVTRDAEFDLSQEEINATDALIKAIKNRKKGKATRLVYDRNIPSSFLEYLIKRLNMSNEDSIIAGGRIHNFKDFMKFPRHPFKKKHIYSLNDRIIPHDLHPPTQIMDVIRKKDISLSLPYHSFEPMIDLIREAAIDPHVEEIYITIYRLAQDSKILHTLVNAARNGKKVVAILELRARFDEANNIFWKDKLEEEGVQVFVGTDDYKVHAKLCLIKRNDGFENIEYFGIYSTGNFNESTAKIYADYCILTSDRDITNDISVIFEFLKSPNKDFSLLKKAKTIITSPLYTRSHFLKLIDQEIKNAKKGLEARIIIKLNSLSDDTLIQKLQDAAESGVKTDIIIRGLCCLIPQGKGARNMRVISIVDHYLEHARVMVFHNNGDQKVFISSADWMVRNLDHRIETTFPITDPDIKEEMIKMLDIQLLDNVKARIIDKAQKNEYVANTSKPVRSQKAILDYLRKKNTAGSAALSRKQE